MAYGLDILADPGLSWAAGDDALFGGAPSDPLSIRLNNPGAIRRSGVQWSGMRPEQNSPFVDFETPEDGIRAMSKLLDTYSAKHGLNTVSGILNRWVPPSENDTRGYAATVAKALGVAPDQPLDLSDPRVKSALMAAMARVEAGKAHYTQDQIMAALSGQPAPNSGAPKMAEYDVDQGLANMDEMSRRVAMMRPQGLAALAPQQQPGGLSGLSPYLQLAAQLMPQRQGSGVWDAIGAAGAAMMQSQSPNFGAGLGAGLSAANQAMAQRQGTDRQDTLDRFKLGMQLAQYDQKDGGEWAMSDNVLYNKKTGQTQQIAGDKPLSDAGKLQSDLRAGRITPEQYEAAMAKIRGEGESPVMRAMREAGIDPMSPDGQKLIRDYAARVGGGATVNIDTKAETAFNTEVAKADAKTWTEIQAGASEAPRSNARLDRLNRLLEGVQTGKYSTSLMELQKGLRTALGDNAPTIFGKAADVAQAEAAQALGNEIALTLRNPAGGAGMPGAMSDADRMFLQSMVPGLETTPEGRRLMVETAKKLNNRNVEIARLAQEYRAKNGGKFDGWSVFLADWAEKNPLFAGVSPPEAPKGGATTAPPPGARELPPSDADVRKAQPGAPQSGGILPKPKRFDLGTAPKVGAQPPAGNIPKFTDPNDPGLAKLPSGSVFYDGNGTLRVKP